MVNDIRHVIIIRFLSRSFKGVDVLSESVIRERLYYLVNNTILTLNNQTDTNFSLVLLLNPNLPKEMELLIENTVNSVKGLKYSISFIPHDDSYFSYIEHIWNENRILCLTRMDDDDFVTRYAVEDLKDLINKISKPIDVLACGYRYGYKFIEGENELGVMKSPHTNGHIAIFQTFVYDTERVKFNKRILPYTMNHTNIVKALSEQKCPFKLIHFDRKNSFIYFRHKSADSYSRTLKNPQTVKLTKDLKNECRVEFGINEQIW